MGIPFANGTPPGGPSTVSGPVLSFGKQASPLTVAGADAGAKTLTSATAVIASGQKVKITISIDLKMVAGGQGVHGEILDGVTQIWGINGQADFICSQSTESEAKCLSFVFQPSAGTHTYNFVVQAAIGTSGYTVQDAMIICEVYN